MHKNAREWRGNVQGSSAQSAQSFKGLCHFSPFKCGQRAFCNSSDASSCHGGGGGNGENKNRKLTGVTSKKWQFTQRGVFCACPVISLEQHSTGAATAIQCVPHLVPRICCRCMSQLFHIDRWFGERS